MTNESSLKHIREQKRSHLEEERAAGKHVLITASAAFTAATLNRHPEELVYRGRLNGPRKSA
jgi:hypothetical protein